MDEFVRTLAESRRTVYRRLDRLVKEGTLERRGNGFYRFRRRSTRGLANRQAERIVATLRRLEVDAHLTGFDVLAGDAHQFIVEAPHIVVVSPAHYPAVETALKDSGYVVLRAGPDVQYPVANLDRVVLLRVQRDRHHRYAVEDHVAAPEKAWVDLLREVRRSRLPFPPAELGRILASLDRRGLDSAALTSYARRQGYLHWLPWVEESKAPHESIWRAIRDGFERG